MNPGRGGLAASQIFRQHSGPLRRHECVPLRNRTTHCGTPVIEWCHPSNPGACERKYWRPRLQQECKQVFGITERSPGIV